MEKIYNIENYSDNFSSSVAPCTNLFGILLLMHASCLSVCLNLAFAFFCWDGIEGDHIERTCWSVRFKIGHFEVLDLPDLKHREFISEGSVTFAIGNLSLHR